MSDYPPEIKVEQQKNGVVVATLNRPEVLNALNGGMRLGIRQLITQVNADSSARVLVLTGAGSAFCSGADLRAKDSRGWPRGPADPEFSWCVDLLQMPKPTIAVVNGVAAGGGFGISLLCDFRFCSQSSRLLPVWAKRGIHPDDLVTWTLPKLAGYSRALKWLYAGSDIPLTDAQHAGLIEPVVADKDLMPTAMAFAYALATGADGSIRSDQTSGAEIFEQRTLGQCCIRKLGAKHCAPNVGLQRRYQCLSREA
jgi:enoyl-CoA hydratase/carnithine racemase